MSRQGNREVNLITIAMCILFALVILGGVFPIVELFVGYLIVCCVIWGILLLMGYRIRDASAMWHAMHDDLETIKKEDELWGLPSTILKKDEDDEPKR